MWSSVSAVFLDVQVFQRHYLYLVSGTLFFTHPQTRQDRAPQSGCFKGSLKEYTETKKTAGGKEERE